MTKPVLRTRIVVVNIVAVKKEPKHVNYHVVSKVPHVVQNTQDAVADLNVQEVRVRHRHKIIFIYNLILNPLRKRLRCEMYQVQSVHSMYIRSIRLYRLHMLWHLPLTIQYQNI